MYSLLIRRKVVILHSETIVCWSHFDCTIILSKDSKVYDFVVLSFAFQNFCCWISIWYRQYLSDNEFYYNDTAFQNIWISVWNDPAISCQVSHVWHSTFGGQTSQCIRRENVTRVTGLQFLPFCSHFGSNTIGQLYFSHCEVEKICVHFQLLIFGDVTKPVEEAVMELKHP